MDDLITKMCHCCNCGVFIVWSLFVVIIEQLIPTNTMHLKLFGVLIMYVYTTDAKFIPNTLQLHCLLPNSVASRCDAKCQGLAALAEHILALPTVIYSHSNLNALIKETIRKTGWAPGEYLRR